MTDDAVSVWCFAGKDMWALTDDDSGHALPAERPQGTRSELRVQRKGEGETDEVLGHALDPSRVRPGL